MGRSKMETIIIPRDEEILGLDLIYYTETEPFCMGDTRKYLCNIDHVMDYSQELYLRLEAYSYFVNGVKAEVLGIAEYVRRAVQYFNPSMVSNVVEGTDQKVDSILNNIGLLEERSKRVAREAIGIKAGWNSVWFNKIGNREYSKARGILEDYGVIFAKAQVAWVLKKDLCETLENLFAELELGELPEGYAKFKIDYWYDVAEKVHRKILSERRGVGE